MSPTASASQSAFVPSPTAAPADGSASNSQELTTAATTPAQARSSWALGPRSTASVKAASTSLLLSLIPVVKNASGSNAVAYAVAAPAKPVMDAIFNKILPEGSREYKASCENAESLRRARFSTTVVAYLAAAAAGNELPKQLSGAALGVTGAAVSAIVGQVVAHVPTIVEELRGKRPTQGDLNSLPSKQTMQAVVLSSIFGAIAGGEIDIANAVTESFFSSTANVEGQAGTVAATYIPIVLAILTFAALAIYVPHLIQNLATSRAAASAQNDPPVPVADAPDDAANAAGVELGRV